MSARYPSFNFRSHHKFELDTPEVHERLSHEAAKQFHESFGKYLSIEPGPVKLEKMELDCLADKIKE